MSQKGISSGAVVVHSELNVWVPLGTVRQHFRHAFDMLPKEADDFIFDCLGVNQIYTKKGCFVDWLELTLALSWVGRTAGEKWVLPGATLTETECNRLGRKVDRVDTESFNKDLNRVMGNHLLRLAHATRHVQSQAPDEYERALLRWKAKFDQVRPRVAVDALAHKTARNAGLELP